MMQRLLQFTLDLFERQQGDAAPLSAPPPSPRKRVKAPKQRKIVPNTPLALVNAADDAIEKEAFSAPNSMTAPAAQPLQTPQTLEEALAPAQFRHPHAVREVMLAGVLVGYAFRRGKRRTIGFSVGPDGLSVAAPAWVPLYEVDKAVLEKSSWILAKLNDARGRQQALSAKRIVWADGCRFPYLGQSVMVVLDTRQTVGGAGAQLHTSALDASWALHIGLPPGATPGQIRDTVQAWLMGRARQLFTERLNHYAPTLGVQWCKLGLSSAGTRWGSASADGSIRLNWRLMHFRLPIIDYVVVHELSHLRVMDHSPRFWDTVRAVVPDYAALRGQLRSEGAPQW